MKNIHLPWKLMRDSLKQSALAFVTLTLVVASFAFMPIPQAGAVTENATRWRNNNGSETAATWNAAENTSINLDKNTPKRLRFGIENTGAESDLTRVNSTTFGDTINEVEDIVLDTANGFGYAISSGVPSTMAKILLSNLTIVDVIHMNDGENRGISNSLAIDTSGGYLYWASGSSPINVVKIRLSDFTRVDTLTLNGGENLAGAVVIDTTNDFLYVGTRTNPAKVVKVDLSDFTRSDVVTFAGGESYLRSGVIDISDGMTYWGLLTSPGKVVAVDLTPTFEITGSTVSAASGDNHLISGVIDTTNNFAYFGTNTSPGRVVKVNTSSFGYTSTLTLDSGENRLRSAAIDIAEGKAFFGAQTSVGKVVEVDLSGFTRTGSADGNAGENMFDALAIDVTNDLLYAGSYDDGDIVKFDFSSTLARSSGNDLSGVSSLYAGGVIDEENGFGYFGSYENQGRIHKVNLSTLALVGTIEVPGDIYFTTAVIDKTNGFAYFSTDNWPSEIIKINLSTFTYVSTLTTSVNGNYSSAIDVANGFAYFAGYLSPGKVAKIDLSDFSEDSVLTTTGYDYPYSMDIDTINGYLFLGMDTATNQILRVTLSDFSTISALDLNAGEDYIEALVIDDAAGFGYAATYNNNGLIIKFSTTGMTRTGVTDTGNHNFLGKAEIDAAKSMAYFPTDSVPGVVVQLNLDNFSKEAELTLAANEANPIVILVDSDNGKAYVGTYDSEGTVIELDITPNPELRLEFTVKSGSCAASTGWAQVADSTAGGAWKMYNSSYVTHAEATTNVGSGVTDGNTNFLAGELLDTSAQMSRVALGFDDFTEVEYSIEATSAAADGATYCFRLTDAGTPTDFTYSNYAEATLPGSPTATTVNSMTLSRHKAGETTTIAIAFDLTGTVSTDLVVTFPNGFTVTGAFTTGVCSGGGTIGTFSFTSSTLTANKSSCQGTVTLSGATATLPGTPGLYVISWVNDGPGEIVIPVIDDDQVSVSASVDQTMVFDLDIGTSDVNNDAGYTIAFGNLVDSAVKGSDDSAVDGIWIDLETNASAGAVVQVKNANGSSGMVSASVPGDGISSLAGENAMSAGTENYGICVSSAGNGTPTAANGTFQKTTGNFDGTCGTTPASNSVGGLTTTFVNILNTNTAPAEAGSAQIRVMATISSTTEAHDDYSDTITFRATSTF